MPPTKAMGEITQNHHVLPIYNTIIDIAVLGYGPIRTGEGAAAPFNRVHILGKIQPRRGFDTLAESRWADLIGPSIPVRNINHTTIMNRPWDRDFNRNTTMVADM
jgi:hypothetical protein